MIKVDTSKGLLEKDLIELSTRSGRIEERERLLVLAYSAGGMTVPKIAKKMGRCEHGIRKCIKRYNETGLHGISYCHGGGKPSILSKEEQQQLCEAVTKPPRDFGVEYSRWTWKIMIYFAEREFGKLIKRSTALNYLKQNNIVLKRAKKRFLKSSDTSKGKFQSYLDNVEKNEARMA